MAALRKVRTLHLRSVDQALIQRGVILIEDALRTASLPGVDGARLILVRRLSLGAVDSGWLSGTVAMLIEERFRRLASSAVHAEEPGGETAPAVYFHDEVEPYVALAVRIAQGKDTSAWFWPRAVSAWRPELSKKDALRSLLFSVLTTTPGCLSGLRLLRALVLANALSVLLAGLNAEDGPEFLRAFGWSRPTSSESAPETNLAQILPDRFPWQQILADACVKWGQRDSRSFWLASALLSIARPALQQSPALPQYALSFVHLVQKAQAPQSLHATDDGGMLLTSESSWGRTSEHSPSAWNAHPSIPNEFPSQLGMQDSSQAAAAVFPVSLRPPEKPNSSDKRLRSVTSRAGLFFLLTVLERTGLPQWLESHTEEAGPDFPRQILRSFVRRLETPSEDPIWSAIEEAEEPCSGDFMQLWTSNARTYCRRVARIGLHSLICRFGRISATPTHIDILMPASDADICVRRAGLDFDLGWVPWFGRVVHFHYLSQGDFNV